MATYGGTFTAATVHSNDFGFSANFGDWPGTMPDGYTMRELIMEVTESAMSISVQTVDGITDVPQDLFTTFTYEDGDAVEHTLNFEDATFSAGVLATWEWPIVGQGAWAQGDVLTVLLTTGPAEIEYNCDCTDPIGDSYKTLAQLRRRMMIRLGFAAQADSPPPGMAILIDDFLQSAQTLLMQKHRELRTERFFTWVMTPGLRLYGIWDNVDACAKKLDPLKLKWVGIEDQGTDTADGANGTWLPLMKGIRPEYYTTVTSWGMPSCYEIRACIEVFPAPDRAYKLRVKADFYEGAFVADGDKTSINSELVFLWALGDAKAHYGKPDAGIVKSAAVAFLGDLKAGRHNTARYIPGAAPLPNIAKPLFLPLVGE